MTVQTLQQRNAYLMQTLNFTPEDLAANRKGSLTPAQQERLKTTVAQGMRTVLIVAALVILIIVAICVYIVLGSLKIVPLPEEVFGSNALLIVGVMGVVLVFYVLMLIVSMSKSRRMSSGKMKVSALTGKVKVSAQGMTPYSAASIVGQAAGAPTVAYVVKVGREKIYTADEAFYRAFEDGAAYRVYVVGGKRAYMIVSAEAVAS